MKKYIVLAVVGSAALSGCASVIDGTSQSMTVATNPPGADCKLMRNDKLLARVTTPQTVTIKKTKHDIDIACDMDGFYKSKEHVKSEIQDATWGNIILGGGIGWAVDSASGADNKYKDYVISHHGSVVAAKSYRFRAERRQDQSGCHGRGGGEKYHCGCRTCTGKRTSGRCRFDCCVCPGNSYGACSRRPDG